MIAWNMATSGIYENFSGDRPNVCMGQTIFGLTSVAGQSDILDINFVSSVDNYIGSATGIYDLPNTANSKCYDLLGRQLSEAAAHKGIFIQNRKKVKR